MSGKRLVTSKELAAGAVTAQPADEAGGPVGKSRESRITMTFRKKNITYSMPHGLGGVPSQVIILGVSGGWNPGGARDGSGGVGVTPTFVNAPQNPYFPGPRELCVTEDFISLRCPTDWTLAEILLRR